MLVLTRVPTAFHPKCWHKKEEKWIHTYTEVLKGCIKQGLCLRELCLTICCSASVYIKILFTVWMHQALEMQCYDIMWQEFVEKGLLVINIDICSCLKGSVDIPLDNRVSKCERWRRASLTFLLRSVNGICSDHCAQGLKMIPGKRKAVGEGWKIYNAVSSGKKMIIMW